MDDLIFQGEVSTGVGCYSSLLVPGRNQLPQAAADWPTLLYPGSLNIRVSVFSSLLKEHCFPEDIAALDRGLFIPEFEILRDEFGNNKLRPTPEMPRRGDAQVWRAKIVTSESEIVDCWVLRRYGSMVGNQLEFVANRMLRQEGLFDNQSVLAVLFGHWSEA